jgi:hypothetical protein
MKILFTLIVMVFMLSACEKYKEACHQLLDHRIKDAAIALATSCEGNIEMAKELFMNVPNIICTNEEVEESLINESDAMIANMICPLVIKTMVYAGEQALAEAMACKKPLSLAKIEQIISSTVCLFMPEDVRTFKEIIK